MAARIAPDVRARIVTLLGQGTGCNETARIVGCNAATVSRIAAAEGIDQQRCRTQKATMARQDYDQARRVALLNTLFDKAVALAPDVDTPSQLQSLSLAVAVLIDKRRLEDGEATARTETNDAGAARERIARRLDELSARRDAHRAAG